ncbi:MAG: hypothetical protein QM784_32270 [Polyangiaceae bacterium]
MRPAQAALLPVVQLAIFALLNRSNCVWSAESRAVARLLCKAVVAGASQGLE